MKDWDQQELPWPEVHRVVCRKCRGQGTIYAGTTFKSHGNITNLVRQTNCPECLGVGTILAPHPD